MVKTHRELDKDRKCDRDYNPCFVCDVLAHYWTQDEYPDGEKQGPVVYHCQRHRKEARAAAIAQPPAECPECGADQCPD